MIKATGRINGQKMEVIVTDDRKYLFNGKADEYWQEELEWQLSQRWAMGGTYYPEKDELLNFLNVLERHFFDNIAEVETDESVPTMEHEEGRVY